jgi:hypothetical protein
LVSFHVYTIYLNQERSIYSKVYNLSSSMHRDNSGPINPAITCVLILLAWINTTKYTCILLFPKFILQHSRYPPKRYKHKHLHSTILHAFCCSRIFLLLLRSTFYKLLPICNLASGLMDNTVFSSIFMWFRHSII